MSTETKQAEFGDHAEWESGGQGDIDWTRYVEQYDSPWVIARAAGVSQREVRKNILEGVQRPPPGEDPDECETRLPHELGLTPLGCGNEDCGEPEIVIHPCPECGFDPREAKP